MVGNRADGAGAPASGDAPRAPAPPRLQPGDHYREIYLRGLAGEKPTLPVSWAELESAAEAAMDERAAAYVLGSAGSEDTARDNREAFRRRRVVPRMLRDVAERNLAVSLAGTMLNAPLGIAPVGVQCLVHPEGEVATARAAATVGLPMMVSSVSDYTLEQIAAELGDTPRFFQLYWPNERELAASFVARAERAGYGAIVLTVDNAFPGWKPRDLQQAFTPPLQAMGVANYFSDPVFCAGLETSPEDDQGAAVGRFISVFPNPSLGWADLEWLRGQTSLPIFLKGILHPDDARLAAEHGADGIVVSNHGGRQVDGAVAALDALAEIAEAVGGQVSLCFDSGVRSGADAFKALALGAEAVFIGRPVLWGLALEGEAGVEAVLRRMLAELDLTVGLSGYRTVAEIGPEALSFGSG